MTMLAWMARTGVTDEDAAWIVFAVEPEEATEAAAKALDVDPFAFEIERTEWADKYAPGPVPRKAMIDNGWWFECHQCGTNITQDSCDEDDGHEPVERGNQIWCRASCRDQYDIDQDMFKRIEVATIEYLKLDLLRQCHGAEIVDHEYAQPSAYVCRSGSDYRVEHAGIFFRFPGCMFGSVRFGFDEQQAVSKFIVCSGDVPAFECWRDAGCPTEMPRAEEISP